MKALQITIEQLALLEEIANSTSLSVWQIKWAKAILGYNMGRSVKQLVKAVRVPPDTIEKVLIRFSREGLDLFKNPPRKPTQRERRVEKMHTFLNHPEPQDASNWDTLTVHYPGKDFSAREILAIRELITKVGPGITTKVLGFGWDKVQQKGPRCGSPEKIKRRGHEER